MVSETFKPCPFCAATLNPCEGKGVLFWMHPGVVTDDDCVLSGRGVSPDGAGLSPTVQPASGLSGSAASIPDADPYADMPPKMRKFMMREPKRLSEESISARRTKSIRRSKPKGILEELCEMQNWRCDYCRRSMRRKARKDKSWLTATLDHVVPISRGGRNQRSNLVAACSGCNSAKGSMSADEYRAAIAIEAGTAETEGLSPKGESAGREASPVSSSIRSAMEGE